MNMKFIKRATTAILAAVMCLSFSSCGDTSYIAKAEGETIPAGLYILSQYAALAEAQQTSGYLSLIHIFHPQDFRVRECKLIEPCCKVYDKADAGYIDESADPNQVPAEFKRDGNNDHIHGQLGHAKGNRKMFCNAQYHGGKGIGSKPVSYTHLDVYKRQRL